VGSFDTITDALFILVLEGESASIANGDIYFYLAIVFTAVPYALSVTVATTVSVRQALQFTSKTVQASWFGVVALTILSGDFIQSLVLGQILLAFVTDTIDQSSRIGIFTAAFGRTHAVTVVSSMFLAQLLLRDAPHIYLQATVLTATPSINIIVLLSFMATIIMTFFGIFIFIFFSFVPLLQHSRTKQVTRGSSADLLDPPPSYYDDAASPVRQLNGQLQGRQRPRRANDIDVPVEMGDVYNGTAWQHGSVRGESMVNPMASSLFV